MGCWNYLLKTSIFYYGFILDYFYEGGYMLKEADGTTRVVEYTADKHNGFNAIVKRIGHAEHPQIYKKYDEGSF